MLLQGKVTYDSRGFLEKNKDPLSQDVTVLMQFSDDELVADIFKEKADVSGQKRFKSARFIGAFCFTLCFLLSVDVSSFV